MNIQKFYEQAYQWIITIGPRIVIAVIILLLGFWIIRIIKKWLNHHLIKKEVNTSVRPFLINLFGIAMQIILLLMFMQIIGLRMTILTALVGAFGVAAGGFIRNFTKFYQRYFNSFFKAIPCWGKYNCARAGRRGYRHSNLFYGINHF